MSSESEGGNDRERGRERDRGERTYLLVAMLSYYHDQAKGICSPSISPFSYWSHRFLQVPYCIIYVSSLCNKALVRQLYISVTWWASSWFFQTFSVCVSWDGWGLGLVIGAALGQIMWQSLACMHLFSLVILPNSHTPFPIQKN